MRSPYKMNLALSVIFIICLAIVLLAGINKALFLSINSSSLHIYPFFWANLTFLGDMLSACIMMLLFIRKKPDLVWSALIATLIATVVVNILKYYITSPRPPSVIDKDMINIIGPALFSHSFPSGHTVTIFTLAGLFVFNFRSIYLRVAMIFLAILIGISRIAVGVHWPVDVLAGAALGLFCATAGVCIVERVGWKRKKSVQLIIGFLLILCAFYLLLFYDCRYEQAIYLQSFMAISVLVVGIREYYFLLIED